YNGSQEINNQTNHHLYASLPWSSSDNHSASQFSSILRTKENSRPTYNSNSYSKSTNNGTRLSGSLSKRNHSETLQTSIYNLSSFGNDLPSNSAYVEGTVDNSTLAKAPEDIASPSPAAMQDTSAIKTTLSRLSPDSRITHNRMTVSEENSIPVSVSTTTPQYKSNSTVAPYFQTDAKTNQSLEPFFPSTGRSKLLFAPNPAAFVPNAKNEFNASTDENTTVVSKANNFHLEEARPDSTYIVGTTNMIKSSELIINKATTPEGRPTVAMTSLPAKTAGVLTLRTRFGSLIDKEIANEEESTPDVEVKSVVEEDSGFQIESLPPAHNSKYFESGDRGFERNGFVSVDTTKSLSPLSGSMPTTEVAISDRDFTSPRGENYVLYVIKPENDRMHFQTLATKTIANGLGKTAVVKQNVEAADGTEFLLPSNSISQIGRMDKPILHNSYYDVISDNPLIITKENPNVVQSIMKHELPLSTLDNADIVDYIDGYQAPAAIPSSNANRLANKGKMAGAQTTNIPLGISTISDDISY
ncbi:hypothetical protein Celaphus_00017402, partial [Cervus elaphus hippelaphus]